VSRDGPRLHEAAEALSDGYAEFLRPGPCRAEPTPDVMRLVADLGGGDVVWDAGDRRWRWRDAGDVR
jgi:hypothetical protein